MKKLSIVNVWTWFANVLDAQTLTASEQLVMLHTIKFLNRNYWKPMKISISALCRSSNKDSRTVKTAISTLIAKGLLIDKNGELFLKFEEDSAESKRKTKTATTPSLIKKQKPTDMGKVDVGNDFMVMALAKDLKENGKLNPTALEIFKRLDPELQKKIEFLAQQ